MLTIVTEEKGNAKEVDETSGLTEFQKEVCELARQVQFFPTLKDEEPVEQKINIRFSQPIL
ncbi:MAG: energy transducer TonB [Verrucomicrobia bacterium]|nr:energy transducer TonB [Verrucomicrobiota bacterium]